MNGNKMSGWTIIGIIMIVVLLLSAIGGCDSDSSSDYSSDYRNDKSYRDNVNKVADILARMRLMLIAKFKLSLIP